MSDEMKKYLVIALTVICVGVAGFMTYRTFFGGGGGDTGSADGSIALMCKSCGGFEVSISEFRDVMAKNAGDMMMMEMGQMSAMECPKCHQKSCYLAQKCPKCAAFFVMNQARDPQFPDRCPKCRYSMIEDQMKNPQR